jgi:hypothetical protein
MGSSSRKPFSLRNVTAKIVPMKPWSGQARERPGCIRKIAEGHEKEKPMILSCYGSRSQNGRLGAVLKNSEVKPLGGSKNLTMNDDIAD